MERTDEDLLDIGELASHLKVNRRTIRRMIAEGRLPPPVRYGGVPRWRWGVLSDWKRAMEMLDRLDKCGQRGTETTQEGTTKKRG